MNLELLAEQVFNQANSACACLTAGSKEGCLAELVDLRNLLNEQPMLEAGGACEADGSSDGKNHEL